MTTPNPQFHNTEDLKGEIAKISKLAQEIMQSSENLYCHTFLYLGILNRTYELAESAIWAIEESRPQTAANMLRALIETLGFTHYVSKQMQNENSEFYQKMTSLLLSSRVDEDLFKAINILTCIDGATSMFPDLRKNYDDLSEMVHPNGMSIMHFAKAEEDNRNAEICIPFYEFKGEDKERVTNQIGECCHFIHMLCEEAWKETLLLTH